MISTRVNYPTLHATTVSGTFALTRFCKHVLSAQTRPDNAKCKIRRDNNTDASRKVATGMTFISRKLHTTALSRRLNTTNDDYEVDAPGARATSCVPVISIFSHAMNPKLNVSPAVKDTHARRTAHTHTHTSRMHRSSNADPAPRRSRHPRTCQSCREGV